MKNEDNVLFEINGFKVLKDSLYTVKNRPDANAPSGFQKEGTTKLPSEGIDEVFQCTYSLENKVWDTGFYEFSPCYRNHKKDIVASKVAQLRKNILEPYMTQAGIDSLEAFHHKNDSFWDEQSFKIHHKKFFNTSIPKDVLELYFALQKCLVAPKADLQEPRYNNAAYILIDSAKDLKLSEERALDKMNATALFIEMLNNKKSQLLQVFKFVNVKLPVNPETSAVMLAFEEKIASKEDKIKEFSEACKKSNTDEGLQEIIIYSLLTDPKVTGKQVTKTANNMVAYQGVELGPDFKSAAKNLAYNKELSDLKAELIISDDED